MSESFSLLLTAVLVPLAYEDFRLRRVGVVWLVLAGIIASAVGYADGGLRQMLADVAVNSVLLLLLGLFLAIYLRLRGKRFFRSFGAGDAVFLLVATPLFTPAGYLRFLIAACMVSLGWWAVVGAGKKRSTIPFVGMMCLVLVVYIPCKVCGLWS